jgi:uncharacterized protein with HEPN domain
VHVRHHGRLFRASLPITFRRRAPCNFVIHVYHQVDLDRVWKTATDDIAELIRALTPLLPPIVTNPD